VSKEPTVEIELVSACVGDLNTVLRGDVPWPILYGIGENMMTDSIIC
jgi:protein N-terminal asparagine amidohydrolase